MNRFPQIRLWLTLGLLKIVDLHNLLEKAVSHEPQKSKKV